MKLFSKNQNIPVSEKAAGIIANSILKVQRYFAGALGKLSISWKRKQQWIFLYMVCLVFGGLSIFSIVQSFSKTTELPKPSAIKVPRNIHKEQSVRITENEFSKVQAFKRSLDSTSRKKLMQERPGLMDSLEMVEQLYYSQKK